MENKLELKYEHAFQISIQLGSTLLPVTGRLKRYYLYEIGGLGAKQC